MNTIRKLTPRECFNFQGYPADYKSPKDMSKLIYISKLKIVL
ncbi:DNA cytosine methyltransferase [Proteus penneri]